MATNYIPEVMTEAARDAIVDPVIGLIICNSDTNKLNYFDGSAWVEVGGGGGMWASIQKQVIGGGVSQVDFESGLTGKDAYILVGSNVGLSADAELRIRVKAAGAYKSGSADYDWAHHVMGVGGPASGEAANVAFMEMTFSTPRSAAGEHLDFEILFGDISVAGFHPFAFRCWYLTASGGNAQVTHGFGTYITSDDIEGVRIYPSTGNIDEGTLELFGR